MKTFYQYINEATLKPDTVDWVAMNVKSNPSGVAHYLVSMFEKQGIPANSIFTSERVVQHVGESLFRLLLINDVLQREENGYIINPSLLV